MSKCDLVPPDACESLGPMSLTGHNLRHRQLAQRGGDRQGSGPRCRTAIEAETPEVTVASSDRALVAAGEKRIVLADHTKIGTETMWQTLDVDQMDVLVIDSKPSSAEVQALRNEGVEVIVAVSD